MQPGQLKLKRKYGDANPNSGQGYGSNKRARTSLYPPIRSPGTRGTTGSYGNTGVVTTRSRGGEVKSMDVISSNLAVTRTADWTFNQTALIVPINCVTPGSSSWNRIGRKIALKSVHINGNLSVANANNEILNPQYCRMILIYDKSPNGALPNIGDIIQDQPQGALDTHYTDWLSGLNLNNKDRFEFIRDAKWTLPCGNTSIGAVSPGIITATSDKLNMNVYVKLRDRETHFKGDSAPGGIGDIATGSLLLVCIGNLPAGQEIWDYKITTRLRYSDL